MTNLDQLPPDLPVPHDDGAAEHLARRRAPALVLPSTSGQQIALDQLGDGRTVIYVYPLTGRPGVDLPAGWNESPERGCTPEARGFRDHHDALLAAGATQVFGLSSQDSAYQQEFVERLHLPFAVLSDIGLAMAQVLGLPTFQAGGVTLFKRLTLVICGATIEHAFYPIFPPNEHAQEVLAWLQIRPLAARPRHDGRS